MKKFKDFLYDKNDLIIALLVLIAATLIIIWRMDAIMEYPKTLISDTESTSTETDVTSDLDEDEHSSGQNDSDDVSSSDNGNPDTSGGSDSQSLWANGVLSREITVNVSGLSASEAVQCLVDAGLFTDYAEYQSVCTAAGLDHQKISAGSFTFAKGSSKANIADTVNWG